LNDTTFEKMTDGGSLKAFQGMCQSLSCSSRELMKCLSIQHGWLLMVWLKLWIILHI